MSSSVALYARTSRPDQSTVQQLVRLRDGTPEGAAEFVDDGVSGRRDSRPALDHLLSEVAAGRVRELRVLRMDRLGRTVRGILRVFDECEKVGCRIVVVDQAIDTSTATGRLVRNVLASVSELEGDLIRSRTKDALDSIRSGARATRSGRPIGRPSLVSPDLIAEIQRLREHEGLEWSRIAVRVHHPASSCRKWYSASKAGKSRVIKRPDGFGAAVKDQGVAPSQSVPS